MTVALAALTLAFIARVIGQLVVAVAAPSWLPPMQAWQSGLLPYPVLLFSQMLIIGLQVLIIWAAGWNEGPLASLGAAVGWVLVALAAIYYAGNTYRAYRRSQANLEHWWSLQLIPIIFHYVLATCVLLWGLIYLV